MRGWADDEEWGYYLEEVWVVSTLGLSMGSEEAITGNGVERMGPLLIIKDIPQELLSVSPCAECSGKPRCPHANPVHTLSNFPGKLCELCFHNRVQ